MMVIKLLIMLAVGTFGFIAGMGVDIAINKKMESENFKCTKDCDCGRICGYCDCQKCPLGITERKE